VKGKLWELGPFVIAAAVALYILFGRGAPVSAPVEPPLTPRAAATPRTSSGPGDPTRPQDFLPDPNSKPDPNAQPDPGFSASTRAVRSPRGK
jgi:hypothetical protein